MDAFFILLLLLGVLAGVVAGLFGLGGGILFTPILFLVFSGAGIENPVVLTIGSSLFCTFVAAGGSSLRQFRQRNFYLADGLKVGLFGAFGVLLGKWVITSSWYSETEFVLFFSTLLLYVAWMFWRRGRSGETTVETGHEPMSWLQSLAAGGGAGFVAALAGIGGGGVMVPVMNLLQKRDFQKAVSISSLAIVIISLSGWGQLALLESGPALTAYTVGQVDFGAALPLALGGLAGGFLGAMWNVRIRRAYLQVAFSVLAVGMAARLIWEIL
ncbi:MAG: sulfite exporter TauE/SafE family protein [Balneolaceae bacterium]|nr:sulfite exporter TauE/SafE family protein [Balneolaceae bacterium]